MENATLENALTEFVRMHGDFQTKRKNANDVLNYDKFIWESLASDEENFSVYRNMLKAKNRVFGNKK